MVDSLKPHFVVVDIRPNESTLQILMSNFEATCSVGLLGIEKVLTDKEVDAVGRTLVLQYNLVEHSY